MLFFFNHSLQLTLSVSANGTEKIAPVAIVVGAEQTGLTPFWMDGADLKVVIPMLGKIDSLNVASAATILLFEAARQRKFKTSAI